MNIVIGAISGVIAALLFPYLLKKFKVNEDLIKKVTPIIVVIAAILSVKLYAYYQADNLEKDKAHLSTKLETYEKLSKGDTSGLENQNTNDDINSSDIARGAYALGELNKILKPYVERINAINANITKLSNEELLGNKIYSDKNTLNAAKNFAVQYPLLIEEDLALFEELVVAQRKTIDGLEVDKKFINEMKGGFEKSVTTLRKLRIERINASKRFSEKVKVVVQLAEKNFGKVKITNDGIDFQNAADNALYNKNFDELQLAAADEEKALKALSEHQANSIEKMKAIAK
jgi:hypothetical protein